MSTSVKRIMRHVSKQLQDWQKIRADQALEHSNLSDKISKSENGTVPNLVLERDQLLQRIVASDGKINAFSEVLKFIQYEHGPH